MLLIKSTILFIICSLCLSFEGKSDKTESTLIALTDLQSIKGPPSVKLEIHKDFLKPETPTSPDDITLSLQMDIRRTPLLSRHSTRWNGPLSVAVLIEQHQWDELKKIIAEMPINLKDKMRMHVVVAEKRWQHYPINSMRNVALDGVATKWTFILDSDEDTIFNMDTYKTEVNRGVQKLSPEDASKAMFVVTSWQWENQIKEYPMTKKQIKKLFEEGYAVCKAPQFLKAYKPPTVSLSKWLSNTDIERTDYGDAYEPYFIAATGHFPRFDPRFVGFGGDKAFQTITAATSGYGFYILPNVFTFVSDTRKMSSTHAPMSDRGFILKMWKELGKQYGCHSCWHPSHCVEKCPWMVKKSSHNGEPAKQAAKAIQPPVKTESSTSKTKSSVNTKPSSSKTESSPSKTTPTNLEKIKTETDNKKELTAEQIMNEPSKSDSMNLIKDDTKKLLLL
eukprot:c20639_g2_i1.p1 GENE.c20639_g2_i1~~c20639_g2_i1.p1  ORF type:complete len:456 (+),score=181.79 c20639_g2_i1:23-1369(+)